jgi:hypothetical protein
MARVANQREARRARTVERAKNGGSWFMLKAFQLSKMETV